MERLMTEQEIHRLYVECVRGSGIVHASIGEIMGVSRSAVTRSLKHEGAVSLPLKAMFIEHCGLARFQWTDNFDLVLVAPCVVQADMNLLID